MSNLTRCPNCFGGTSETNLVHCAYCDYQCCDDCIDEHEDDCEEVEDDT